MNKAFWTEEEYKQRVAAAAGRGDAGRQAIEKGEFGRALLSGVTDPTRRSGRPHSSSTRRTACCRL